MTAWRARRRALVAAAALAAATGGCSWLLGVSEDPVIDEAAIDGGADANPDAEDAPIE